MAGVTPFVGSFQAMSSPLLSVLSPQVVALPATSWSSSSTGSQVVLFLLSTAMLLGQVTAAPKGFDYDIYDDDPYNGLNVIKVNKVVDYYSKPQYAFGYEVDDYYNQLSHGRWEIRDGDVTQGQYRVLLPDGRIQIVSYIADKNGYRPTVEYIGKGVHPPPPPAYANVKIPKILEPVAPVAVEPYPILASAAPPQLLASPQPFVHPTAVPIPVVSASPVPHLKAPLGLAAAPIQEYNPVKIKFNSLPVNGPLPLLDPYAIGYGYGFDPALAASTNVNKISRKRALLYDRTLFRKDVEKRAAVKRKIMRKAPSSTTAAPITENL